ncbi:MAG: hypothetical protein R6U59_02850 [Eubacteriales bacterium]
MGKVKSIPENKKILHTNDLKELGYSYYRIMKLVQDKKLQKLNKSYYENTNYKGEESDLYYIKAYTPKGVACLLTAASYYELTEFRPDAIDVAVPNDRNVTNLPDWPNFNLYYFDKKRYETGIVNKKNERNEFKIYNIEKTVIDIISFRNKVGIEETKEIVRNYIKLEDRNLNKLYRYSKQLRCHDILKKYMEVLV